MTARAYYPVFTDLNGRRCVVIGGGMVAQRKIATLLRYGAQITVISPEATRRVARYARTGRIGWAKRRFRPSDLRGAWLVYAATNDQSLNELVYRTATRQRVFTNVVDQRPLCSFIAPAIMTRGPLTIAISTGGTSPSLAKKLRRELDRTIGQEYTPMLRLLTGLRGVAKQRLPDYNDRKRYFDRLVNGPVFGLVRAGKAGSAKKQALAELRRAAGLRGRA